MIESYTRKESTSNIEVTVSTTATGYCVLRIARKDNPDFFELQQGVDAARWLAQELTAAVARLDARDAELEKRGNP